MRSLLFVLAVCLGSSLCQYDDLSVMEEVLARTSQRPLIRQLPSEGTTTESTTLPSTTVIISSTPLPTVAEIISSSVSSSSSTESSSSTSHETISTEETTQRPTAESSELPSTVAEMTTFAPFEETTDASDMLFMGMKRPDLATIYRRLFPFKH